MTLNLGDLIASTRHGYVAVYMVTEVARDGTAHGHKLTDRNPGFPGSLWSGRNKSALTGIIEPEEWR